LDFSADTKSLGDALEQIQGAVDKRSTIPILSHALVEASATGLHLAATDPELGIRMFCPAPVKVPGNGAIPARRLLDIVRSLPDGEVRVRALENHWVEIGSGRSTFKLAAMAKDNFPALPNVPPALAEVPAGTLGGLIDRTAFAMSAEESRYTLNGALLVLGPGKVEMVLATVARRARDRSGRVEERGTDACSQARSGCGAPVSGGSGKRHAHQDREGSQPSLLVRR